MVAMGEELVAHGCHGSGVFLGLHAELRDAGAAGVVA